jgi:hypothetical protein
VEVTDDRGQGYTLEAIVASMLLLAGLVFALQSTAVTPLSASTSSQHIENQQQATATGALRLAAENDSLREAVLSWNSTAPDSTNWTFYGALGNESFLQRPAGNQTAFTRLLCRTYDSRGIVYNVRVSYQTESGDRLSQSLVYRGAPSDNAARASRAVTLYDDDPLYNRSSVVVENAETHTYDGSNVYVLDETPVVNESVANVHTVSHNFTKGVDYRVIDNGGDGKPDAIDWSLSGATPDAGVNEQFHVDYAPAVDDSRFYAGDVSDGGIYNVLRVEVVVWRQ